MNMWKFFHQLILVQMNALTVVTSHFSVFLSFKKSFFGRLGIMTEIAIIARLLQGGVVTQQKRQEGSKKVLFDLGSFMSNKLKQRLILNADHFGDVNRLLQ